MLEIIKRTGVFLIMAETLYQFVQENRYARYVRMLIRLMTLAILILPVLELFKEGSSALFYEKLNAMEAGYIRTFIEAGAVVSTPTCGPCLGGYMGILAENERCVSTTNRNFVGRMGHVTSEIYLASPAVAAASAITGHISDPAKL